MHELPIVEQLAPAHPVARFKALFALIRPGTPMPLDDVYAPDIIFIDPLHRIAGREPLRAYFKRLNAGLIEGRFTFGEQLVGPQSAMLTWTMHLTLRMGRRTVVTPGISHLHFGEQITYQQDYFDAGALIYEQIPVLGSIIRLIKARA